MDHQLPHIVFLPSPGMGHFIPFLELAKKFVIHHNFTATILIIPDLAPNWSAVQPSYLQPGQLPTGLNYLLLPQPDFSDLPTNMKHEILGTLAVSRSLATIREILTDLLSSEEKLKIVALVVDIFGDQAIDIARELEISPYLFFTMNAMALSSILYLPKLDQRVSCEYGELLEPIQLPGCIPLPGKDVPDPLLNRQSLQYKAFVHSAKKYQTVDGIIVNTFLELEPGALNGLQEEETEFYDNNPFIYPIGPLIQNNSTNHDGKQSVITNWLDTQPLNSVLYVCFGSHWTLSQAQINELALGLETSETRFLWVVRLPKDENGSIGDDPLEFVPRGFIERTKEQGLMVPNWASQQEILMHEAIGGFITHCGWNSTLESIVNGVPMIAWPQGAEQKMNALILTEDVKVAIKVKSLDEDGLVVRAENIAETVKNLMSGEEGKEATERVRELKHTTKMVLREGGSSWNSFADLVFKWKTM